MDPYEPAWRQLTEAVLRGPARLSPEAREAAATDGPGLAAQVRTSAWQVTDAQVQDALAELSEDEAFELVVSAALGAARHRLQKGLQALCD